MKYLGLLFFSMIAMYACEPPQVHDYTEADYIELKKDPCFGFCPVYSIKINGVGHVVYNGERNVPREGTWYRVLSPEETNELFNTFAESGFWQLKDEYTAQVTDLPTTWVTLVLEDRDKTIKDYYGAPEELKKLEAMVEQIAEEEEQWKRELSTESD